MAECSFCRRVADLASLPAHQVVWQFPQSVALLGPWQFYRGYCVLVSRRHAEELSDLDDATRRAFLDEMSVLARAIERAFRPVKMNYELLGNQLRHLHWHLFPRRADDPDARRAVWFALDRAEADKEWRRRMQGEMDPAATSAALRRVLAELGAPHA
jgi:diadenosine tetraphosphate (Ap4A) HIT family hydrolase